VNHLPISILFFPISVQEFLVFHNKISEQNARNVMRQVSKLARGEGIRYESAKVRTDMPDLHWIHERLTLFSAIAAAAVWLG
jgi:hypothetical protein